MITPDMFVPSLSHPNVPSCLQDFCRHRNITVTSIDDEHRPISGHYDRAGQSPEWQHTADLKQIQPGIITVQFQYSSGKIKPVQIDAWIIDQRTNQKPPIHTIWILEHEPDMESVKRYMYKWEPWGCVELWSVTHFMFPWWSHHYIQVNQPQCLTWEQTRGHKRYKERTKLAKLSCYNIMARMVGAWPGQIVQCMEVNDSQPAQPFDWFVHDQMDSNVGKTKRAYGGATSSKKEAKDQDEKE